MPSLNSSELTSIGLQDLEYNRSLGAHRPRFEGIPDNYYPLSKCEVVQYVLMVVACILAVLGIMLGLMQWAIREQINYVLCWVIVLMVFLLVNVLLLYWGGRDRRVQEKSMIEAAQRRMDELQKGHHKRTISENEEEL